MITITGLLVTIFTCKTCNSTCRSRTMAASEVSKNIDINQQSRTHSNSECDDEESFVVLGRSPTSCIFNDQGQIILEEALKSITESAEAMKAKSPEPLNQSIVEVTESFLKNGLQSLPKTNVVVSAIFLYIYFSFVKTVNVYDSYS